MDATFEIYRDGGGQQWARRRLELEEQARQPRYIWYVSWADGVTTLLVPRRDRHWVPDDIQ